MARRKELGSLADGLVGSFVSRNNDVDGYWGVGKLYAFALEQQVAEITIDLLTQEIFPHSETLEAITQTYGHKLVQMLSAYGGCITWLESAQIVLTFDSEGTTETTRWGEPFTCRCRIIDDKAQQHSAISSGYCRPHNPKEEIRRSSRSDRRASSQKT